VGLVVVVAAATAGEAEHYEQDHGESDSEHFLTITADGGPKTPVQPRSYRQTSEPP
jgi:hypothetical protein